MSSAYARTPPLGIKIICILGAVGALASLVLSIFFGATSSPVLAILVLVSTPVSLFLLYGLWTLQSWAWSWTVFIYALSALFSMVARDWVGVLIGVVMFGYVASKGDLYR